MYFKFNIGSAHISCNEYVVPFILTKPFIDIYNVCAIIYTSQTQNFRVLRNF